jgi:hypothetical protein
LLLQWICELLFYIFSLSLCRYHKLGNFVSKVFFAVAVAKGEPHCVWALLKVPAAVVE